ncbi:MAG: phosphonate ABC transporter ATP-binding protein [Halanaerobiaceae bacterium]
MLEKNNSKADDCFIRVHNLKKIYPGGVQALNNVSVDIKKGEIVSLIGSSGAGKTTFLRCLNGLISATEGEIYINNENICNLKGKRLRQYQKTVGIIFQQFNLVNRLNVMKNVLVGSLPTKKGWDFLKAMLGLFSEEEQKEACICLEKVGILKNVWKRVDNLSGGQQQRVAIAKILLQSPQLILADEPIASLDPYSSVSVMEKLNEINRDYGTTVIMNMHYLDYAKQFSTRIIGLRFGEVVFDGAPEELTSKAEDIIYAGANEDNYRIADGEYDFSPLTVESSA